MWKDFGTKFNGILKSLGRHKQLVECRATLSQYRMYQEDIRELNSKLDEQIAEEQKKKMNAVREWLAVGSQPQEDHDGYRDIRLEFPSTGHWILKHESITDWMDADVPTSPLAWLTGIPGAGKTILASNIIDECILKNGYLTSYFYCHYENQGTNTAVGVLRGLIDQLLVQYPALLPPCHTKQTSSGDSSLRSLPLAKKLFEDFCDTIPRMFIVVDGLDECEQIERKQLLDFFIEVVGKSDTEEPGRLRVLFVSQDFADIKRALHSSSITRIVPKVVSLSSTDNESDIQTYVRAWVERIAHKHAPFTEDIKEYLYNLTVARAKGTLLGLSFVSVH